MAGVFELQVLGYVGSDPEMRFTEKGTEMTTFSIAAHTGFGDDRITSWVRCLAFGRSADVINEHVRKGDMLFVRGDVNPEETGEPRKWTARDGSVHADYEIIVRNWSFAGGSKNGGE